LTVEHWYPASTVKVKPTLAFILGYLLPSMGESYASCGTVRFTVQCEGCADESYRLNGCTRAECPICSQTWARRAANRVAERMVSAQNQRRRLKRFKPRHIMLSIPPSLYDLPYNDLLTRGRELMKSITKNGGGLYIGHPWRFVDINGDTVDWKHCSLNLKAESPIIESFGVLGPHLHFIMWGHLEDSAQVFERTGWVYRNLGTLNTREDIFACAYYQLSHCGIHATRHALRWWGFMSYNNFVCVSKSQDLEVQLCPICGGRLWVLDHDGEPFMLYSLTITRRHFKFKVTQKRLEPKKRVPKIHSGDTRHKGRRNVY